MGEPIAGDTAISLSEYIGQRSDTKGSETSQYLEEEKEQSISRVVANETETVKSLQRDSLYALLQRRHGAELGQCTDWPVLISFIAKLSGKAGHRE